VVAALILGEAMTLPALLGCGLIIVGISLVNRQTG